MGTWIKETAKAIYLMEGGYWISRLSKYPSKTNPDEQVLNISAVRSWFMRTDYPRAMTVSLTGPEPSPRPAPPKPPEPAPGSAASGKIPRAAIDIIKEFEGYAERLPDGRARAYADPIHGWAVPTIGYGTTKYPDGRKVKQGDIITREQAEEYLIDHIEKETRAPMERIPTWSQMNDNQRSAIYSFAYNLGSGFYRGSGFKSITAVCDSPQRWKDRAWITEQFSKYRNPGTSAEAGLLRRRKAEADLFLS
ncbi:lysozyme [Leptolyngbya iicbica]|uniref:Lysozyme n=2 Tax=Cyanophyceae TaxID=3028117 RepID=A0A4Q7E121_9CYAN|nr:lysozyme [Leptolyngbya sp. LK]RZM74420.1 lysozyme [Leptolyngbya sp. LK]